MPILSTFNSLSIRSFSIKKVLKWLFQSKIVTPIQANDFGYSVSISTDGNTLVIGSPNSSTTSNIAGVAYTFTRTGSSWTQQSMLTNTITGYSKKRFGYSVSMTPSGNSLVVGDIEMIWTYSKIGNSWGNTGTKTASDGVQGDQFGYSVSISEDGTIATGSPYNQGTGAVYVFSGGTQTKIKIANTVLFGISVSLSSDGNTLVIGSNSSTYVYVRNGTTWTQQALISYSGDSSSISPNGNIVAIGSYRDTVAGATLAGSVYVYVRNGTNWTQQSQLVGDHQLSSESFGLAVSLSNNTLAIASQYGIYIFKQNGTLWERQSKIQSGQDSFPSIAINGNSDVVASGQPGLASEFVNIFALQYM